MENSGIDTEISKPHSTRVASNSAAYKLGMPFQEGSGRHTILEKSRTRLT